MRLDVMDKIIFKVTDMQNFELCSHDVSYLHTNEEYARKTPFGECIVYGGLGVLACLEHLTIDEEKMIIGIQADYLLPFFVDMEYEVKIKMNSWEEQNFVLMQDDREILKLKVTISESNSKNNLKIESSTDEIEYVKQSFEYQNYEKEIEYCGEYGCDDIKISELRKRFHLSKKINSFIIQSILQFSYISGMIIPGMSGMSLGIEMNFKEACPHEARKVDFLASKLSYDKDYGILVASIEISSQKEIMCTGTLKALVREEIQVPDVNKVNQMLIENQSYYKGKTVLITGGSRGLGAALATGFVMQQCNVIVNYKKSNNSAKCLEKKIQDLGLELDLDVGNITSKNYLEYLKKKVKKKYGKIDILILNAFEPIHGKAIAYSAKNKIDKNIEKNLEYIAQPYECFIDMLQESNGTVVLVSSVLVNDESSQEVFKQMKQQAEKYIVNEKSENSKICMVIARPGMMRTDMRNTPIELENSIAPEQVAGNIINALPHLENDKINYLDKIFNDDENEEAGASIVVSSTFVTEPLCSSIEFWKKYLGLNITVKCSGYNQVFQDLLSLDSRFEENLDGLNVLILKIDDWLRYQPDNIRNEQEILDNCTQDFCNAMKEYIVREQGKTPFLLLLCPSNTDVKKQEDTLMRFLASYTEVHVVHYKEIESQYQVSSIFDSIRDQMGHIPYMQEYYNILGTYIVRYYTGITSKPYKVIVTDCDNTLWKGICGEDGAENVSITGSYLGYQNFLEKKYKEGFLICLCSKNDESSVWEVFNKHTEMPLKREHIVCSKINWEEKWINIINIGTTLNLGLDSFIFIDDNPIECAKVRENCPEVMVLEDKKASEENADYFKHLWLLDKFSVTAEDNKRTDMYKMNVNAEKLRENAISFEEFLKNLNLQIEFNKVNDETIDRVAQLYARTNQFNFTTVRWTVNDIKRLVKKENHSCFTVNIRDKFGDYGIVGVMDFTESETSIIVNAFLLSCRVLGRGVEHQMMRYIGKIAEEKKKDSVCVFFKHTEKNLPAFYFLKEIGTEYIQENNEEVEMKIPIERLSSLKIQNKKVQQPQRKTSTGKASKKLVTETQVLEIAKEFSDINKLSGMIENIERQKNNILEEHKIKAAKPVRRPVLEEVKEIIASFVGVSSLELDVDASIEKYVSGSMNIINVTSLLNKKYSRIPITILFEMKTIAKVAEYIQKNVLKENIDIDQEQNSTISSCFYAKPDITSDDNSQIDEESKDVTEKEDIAIIGISFKYPDANSQEELWNNLQGGICSIQDITKEHWDVKRHFSAKTGSTDKSYCKMGGFLDDVEGFDASFFQISPKQAELMDPQQRLFLEVVWKLIEDAGYTRESMDRNTGVFVGMVSNDYAMYANEAAIQGTGSLRYTDYYQVPNRVSFFYDFKGPSMAIDTACSSSGTALAVACDSIKKGECKSAIVGGINLFLHPARYIQYSQMRMLSPEGKCMPFSADAKGTVFGEGIGAILVKKLSDAKRDHDNIYGVIKGYAINSGGKTNGFTVPNPEAQADLVMKALENANVRPSTISYIETHGTGTPLGDPVEIRGLEKAFEQCAEKNHDNLNLQSCPIGSIKGNIGHSESASFIASVIKVLLQMKHKKIVKSLNADILNNMIDFEHSVFYVQQKNTDWAKPETQQEGAAKICPRRAGISTFGAGGSNAHLILEEFDKKPVRTLNQEQKNIFIFSAQNEQSLRRYLKKFTLFLENKREDGNTFTEIAYTLQTGREEMSYRLAAIADGYEELQEKISLFLKQENVKDVIFNCTNSKSGLYTKIFDGISGDNFIQELVNSKAYDKIAILWTNGAKINWSIMYKMNIPNKISIPTYEFIHKTYSIRGKARKLEKNITEMIDHVNMMHSLDKGITFETTFTKDNSIIGEHIVLEKSILPGVGYVEMFLEEMDLILPGKRISIKNVLWLEPVIALEDDVKVFVQVTVSGAGYELVMKNAAMEMVYCKAYAEESDSKEETFIDIEQIKNKCKKEQTSDEIYNHFSNVGIEYGEYYRNLKGMYYAEDEAIGVIELGRIGRAEYNDFKQYIPLMDSALQAAQLMLENKQKALLPFCVSEITSYEQLEHESYVYIKRISADRLDVFVTDKTGKVCVKYKDICLRAAKAPLDDMVYVPRWITYRSEKNIESTLESDDGDVLVFYPNYAKKFADCLIRKYANREIEAIELQSEEISALRKEASLLDEKVETLYRILSRHEKIGSIYYLGAMEEKQPDFGSETFERAQRYGIQFLFYFMKALSKAAEATQNTKLKVITTNVFSVNGRDAIRPFAAGVYGFCKSIASEMPYLDITIFDTDLEDVYSVNEEQRDKTAELAVMLKRGKRDIDLAIRHSDCYQRILEKTKLPNMKKEILKKHGVYLINGGTGGIGMKLAQYLAREYQARIVLTGRSKLNEEKQEGLNKIKEFGGDALYLQSDIANPEQMKETRDFVLQKYQQINGVFHSAIVLRDKSVERMSETELAEAINPKIYGSYTLYQTFKNVQLDFMMFFSSTQAFASNPGQSNYAGGCSFKDAFASWMNQELDYPVKIVNWGYWGNIGIVSSKEYNKRLFNMGYYSVEPYEGMQGIEGLLHSMENQAMICKISSQVQESVGVNTDVNILEEQKWEADLLCQDKVINVPTQEQVKELNRFNEGFSRLERLGLEMLTTFFAENNLFTNANEVYTIGQIRKKLNVIPEYHRLLDAFLHKMEQEEQIKATAYGYEVEKQLSKKSVEDFEYEKDNLLEWYDCVKTQINLVWLCLRNIKELLSGNAKATDIMYPGSSMDKVAGIFKGNPNADYCNDLVSRNVQEYIKLRLPELKEGEKIKILEVGAGTGGTSSVVLKQIQQYKQYVTYVYTDISYAFTKYGRKEYGQYPFIEFKVLNIENDPLSQGYVTGVFDIVIATNVLHATKNIYNTVTNIQSLLKKNGWLVLNEITKVLKFDLFTFGFLKGWWLFEDASFRMQDSPLLGISHWKKILSDTGFKKVNVSVNDIHSDYELWQNVFIAESNGVVKVHSKAETQSAKKEVKELSVKNIESCGKQKKMVTKIVKKPTKIKKMVRKKVEAPKDNYTFVKEKISLCICESLEMEHSEIDFEKSFVEYGIDSILAVDLVTQVNNTLGIVLRTTVLFDYVNVEELTKYITKNYGNKLLPEVMEEVEEEIEIEVEVEEEIEVEVEDEDTVETESEAIDKTIASPPVSNEEEKIDAESSCELDLEKGTSYGLVIDRPKSVDQIAISEFQIREPNEDEVQIKTNAASINFGDILCVKGLYPNMPTYPFVPGFEVSGIVTKTGENVKDIKPGEYVIGLLNGTLGGHSALVNCNQMYVCKKPDNISFVDASAFAVVFLTVWRAFEKAEVGNGDRILIQTAAGGIGLIAVQMAKLRGAEIFATVGEQKKADYLVKMGVKHIINYRTEDFKEKILQLTDNKGMDVVLNTLSGDAIQKGIDILAPEGRYVEIALTGLKSAGKLNLTRMLENQDFYSVDLSKIMKKSPETAKKYMNIMQEYLQKGEVKPTVGKVFPAKNIKEAYQYMEERGNIGKVVLTFDEEPDDKKKESGKKPSYERDVKETKYVPKRCKDIAIIGISGRFPGATNVNQYWDNLVKGKTEVREVPNDRWDVEGFFDPTGQGEDTSYCKWGCFLDNIYNFDPLFFNISGKEAECSEPAQRLFLEECYHALEDAGYAGDSINGCKCGVFAGTNKGDYILKMKEQDNNLEAQTFTGTEPSVLPARISYYLNLKGPALTVDTACSSSLVATHLACNSILSGDCDMAIAGGAFLMNSPDFMVLCSKTGMLSHRGVCSAFDNKADGFIPGEGIGAIILKPYDKAVEDNDNIYGVIKGSGINQDGRTNGLTAPSTVSQAELQREVYEENNINADDITYVEAHGTGTILGDPIELDALTSSFAKDTDRKHYCAIGSVKTNIGHAAQAAGVASIIKVVMALKYKMLCPSLNYEASNQYIDFENSPFYVNTESKPWTCEGGKLRTAAISSFGMSGTNCHMVIQEPPVKAKVMNEEKPAYLITLSAKTESALQKRVKELKKWLEKQGQTESIGDISFTLMMGRIHFEKRITFVVKNSDDLLEQISLLEECSYEKVRYKKVAWGMDNSLENADMERLLNQLAFVQGSDYADVLKQVAAGYLDNKKADWMKLFAKEEIHRISLPGYPFEEEVYCVQPIRKKGKSQKKIYVHHFTGNEKYCRDHIVNKNRILPGVLSMSLVYKYGQMLQDTPIHCMKNFVWVCPIPVDAPIDVKMKFQQAEEKVICHIKDAANGTVFGQGELVTDSYEDQMFAGKELDIASIKKNMEPVTNSIYPVYEENGICYGSSMRVVKQLYRGAGQALSYIELSPASEDGFRLNPYGLDGILQTIIGTFTEEEKKNGNPFVPYSVGKITILSELPNRFYVYVVEKDSETGSEAKKFDFIVAGQDGEIILSITDYFARHAKKQDTEFLCYEGTWKRKDIVQNRSAGKQKTLLLFEENNSQLHNLEHDYTEIYFVTPGDKFRKLTKNIYQIHLGQDEDYEKLINTIGEIPDDVLFHWNCTQENNESAIEKGYFSVMNLCKCFMNYKVRKQISIISVIDGKQPILEAQSGFAQCMKQENSHYRMKTILSDEKDIVLKPCIRDEFEEDIWSDTIISYQKQERFVKSYQLVSESVDKEKIDIRDGGTYLITGGMGGLGRLFANHIANKKSITVILTGRRSYTKDQISQYFDKVSNSSKIVYIPCNIADVQEAEMLIRKIHAEYGKLTGVIHCAGVVKDALIRKKTRQQAIEVFAAKINGLDHLYTCTKDEQMDFFVAFSSTAAIIGNAGQSDYAYGNTYMDAFFEQQQSSNHGRTKYVSINWPLWESGGMQVDAKIQEEYFKKWGMGALSKKNGLQAFHTALQNEQGNMMAFYGSRAKLEEVLGISATREMKTAVRKPESDEEYTDVNSQNAIKYVKQILERVIHIPAEKIMEDEPLETYGIDSMLIMSLTSELDKDFPDLSRTLFFEYQTVGELAEYLNEKYKEKIVSLTGKEIKVSEAEIKTPSMGEKSSGDCPYLRNKKVPNVENAEQDIAIIGLSGRYPQANNIEEFWENLKAGKDSIIEIDRWDNNDIYSPVKGMEGKTYSKWGGFIDDYDKFDSLFFNIAPKEAEMIDPQERIFLETAWKTVEDAGYSRQNLWGRDIGVYVGVMYSQYQLWGAEENMKGNPVVPTASYASIANRVSYVFNFRGPSMAVDTMCSSSLTAIHLACDSIKKGEIESAIAGGVNLSIHPAKYLMLSKGRFAASDGRCHSYGEGGDGYVPGEGVGAVMLKALDRAIEDGDHIYGVIKASTLNHGGKTNGYTVPNPKAQEALIRNTLYKAGISAEDISYVEGHGTGTALGDPIEVNSLTSVYGNDIHSVNTCALGSVKANIGHLESAAGIAALTKVLLQMRHHQIVPSIHSEKLNSNIKFQKTPFYIPHALEDWKTLDGKPRYAAISSFGAGGSNAHVIIEEYVEEKSSALKQKEHPELFVLSARTKENLVAYAKEFRKFLLVDNQDAGKKDCRAEADEFMKFIADATECNQDDLHADDRLGELGFDEWQIHTLADKVSWQWKVSLSDEELSSDTLEEIAGKVFASGGSMVSQQSVVEHPEKYNKEMIERCAYTLQVGREPMEIRLAFLAENESDINMKLKSFIDGTISIPDLWYGENEFQSRKETLEPELYGKEQTVLELLREIAKKWSAGAKVDWSKLYENRCIERMSLPTYPFTRETYWMQINEKCELPGAGNEVEGYPMLGTNKSTLKKQMFQKSFTGNEDFLKDHVVNGEKIMPAAAYMEMALEAGEYSEQTKNVYCIKDIYFVQACKVQNGENTISIDLVNEENIDKFTISSESALCIGKILSEEEVCYADVDIEEMKNKINGRKIGTECYEQFRNKGIEYGNSYRTIQDLYIGDGQVLAKLVLEDSDGQKRYKASLGILDGAFQCVTGLFYEEQSLFLPFSIEKFELLDKLPSSVYVYVKQNQLQKKDNKVFDIVILSEQGNVLAVLTNFCVRQAVGRENRKSVMRYLTSVWVDK